MFGIFKKRVPPGSFIIVAVKSAVLLRGIEIKNGGIHSSPEELRSVTDSIAKQMNADNNENLRTITHACVMALMVEGKFIDRLVARAMNGPLGELTEQDEIELSRITKKFTGVS